MPDTRLVSTKQKFDTIRSLFLQHKDQIAMALPRHVTADRMVRVMLTAMQRDPKLLECTPQSLFAACILASQLGLEPDGALGSAYLIPFRNNRKNVVEVQMLPGYRGLLDLARRSGNVSTIEARVVRADDKFKFKFGLTPQLEHVPSGKNPDAKAIAVYAIAHLRDGGVQFDVMRTNEIEAIRATSKAANSGPWVSHWDEMAKKTVLRRLCKLLPMSIEVQKAVGLDEAADAGLSQALEADLLPEDLPEAPAKATKLDALTQQLQTPEPTPPSEPPPSGDEIFGQKDPPPDEELPLDDGPRDEPPKKRGK